MEEWTHINLCLKTFLHNLSKSSRNVCSEINFKQGCLNKRLPETELPRDLSYLCPLLALTTFHSVIQQLEYGFLPSTRFWQSRDVSYSLCTEHITMSEHRTMSTVNAQKYCFLNCHKWYGSCSWSNPTGFEISKWKTGSDVWVLGLVIPVPLSACQWSGQIMVFSADLGGLRESPKHYRQLDIHI